MKYYKCINGSGYESVEHGKIYESNHKPYLYTPIKEYAEKFPSDWEEVSELEYLKQNGMDIQEQLNLLQKELDDQYQLLNDLKKEANKKVESKVGKWIKIKTNYGNTYLIKITELESDVIRGVGFKNGKWIELEKGLFRDYKPYTYKKPTVEEIEKALITEAKRRGFNDSIKIKQNHSKFNNTHHFTLSSNHFWYDEIEDKLMTHANGGAKVWVYLDGEWAEIIEEEPIKINGHEVKIKNAVTAQVGCASVPMHVFEQLSSHANAFDLSIHRRGEDITKQIFEIAKKL